jgi:probable nitrogen fixation protein
MSAVTVEDALFTTDFIKEMVKQMRALDSYGAYDNQPAERLLVPFVVSKQQRRLIPIMGEPDAKIMDRINAFYNAIAAVIEKECGLMAVPLVNLNQEGFGRVIITVGKLVVVERTLRDMHRFGFVNLAQMKDEADKLLVAALALIEQYPQVANL